jgi:hypothetical protein
VGVTGNVLGSQSIEAEGEVKPYQHEMKELWSLVLCASVSRRDVDRREENRNEEGVRCTRRGGVVDACCSAC